MPRCHHPHVIVEMGGTHGFAKCYVFISWKRHWYINHYGWCMNDMNTWIVYLHWIHELIWIHVLYKNIEYMNWYELCISKWSCHINSCTNSMTTPNLMHMKLHRIYMEFSYISTSWIHRLIFPWTKPSSHGGTPMYGTPIF